MILRQTFKQVSRSVSDIVEGRNFLKLHKGSYKNSPVCLSEDDFHVLKKFNI